MYLVRESDDGKIKGATYLAGERAKELQNTIKDILAFKGDKRISSEIIEQAISILDGEKRWSEVISSESAFLCAFTGEKPHFKAFLPSWVSSVGIVRARHVDRNNAFFAFSRKEFHLAKKRKNYIIRGWNYTPKACRAQTWPSSEKLSECVIPVVRNR